MIHTRGKGGGSGTRGGEWHFEGDNRHQAQWDFYAYGWIHGQDHLPESQLYIETHFCIPFPKKPSPLSSYSGND